jgi:tellurite resistance protein TerC
MILLGFWENWPLYAGFLSLVLVLLFLDLGVFHRKTETVPMRAAAFWTGFWVMLALLFNAALFKYLSGRFDEPVAKQLSLEFLTGFVVEKTLAVDNIFVFAVVFSYFAIPKQFQYRVLFWGIFGALAFRAIFIAIGAVLIQIHEVVIFFGVLLILTGFKLVFSGTQAQNLESNLIVRACKKVFRVHPKIEGSAFFMRKSGLLYATPLFLALLFIEVTDVIFAVDSVPAIFGITKEPFIVFTSNIFAILGLRSMYFLLAGVLDRFVYIKYGLAGVLVFVGLKMVYLNTLFDGKFPISWSLLAIAAMIGTSVIVSLLLPPQRLARGLHKG